MLCIPSAKGQKKLSDSLNSVNYPSYSNAWPRMAKHGVPISESGFLKKNSLNTKGKGQSPIRGQRTFNPRCRLWSRDLVQWRANDKIAECQPDKPADSASDNCWENVRHRVCFNETCRLFYRLHLYIVKRGLNDIHRLRRREVGVNCQTWAFNAESQPSDEKSFREQLGNDSTWEWISQQGYAICQLVANGTLRM